MSGRPGDPHPGVDERALERLIQETVRKALAGDDLRSSAQPSAAASGALSVSTAADRPRAFMVMPFGVEELEQVYEYFVKSALEETCSFDCVRGDDIFGSNVIMDDVADEIRRADVVIADLTGQNANVFYEVGFAHALDKPVLLMAQSIDDVPYDLRHRRVQEYDTSPKGCRVLEERLVEHVQQMAARWTDSPSSAPSSGGDATS